MNTRMIKGRKYFIGIPAASAYSAQDSEGRWRNMATYVGFENGHFVFEGRTADRIGVPRGMRDRIEAA